MYLQIYVCIGLLITFEYCKLSGVECVFNILLECWALILRIWICKIVHNTTALFRMHRKLFNTAILPLPLLEKSFAVPKYVNS